jgi:hypothetical protein
MTEPEPQALPEPATPEEVAQLLAILRAIVATTLTYRKDFSLRLTERQRQRAYGIGVRVAMTTDGVVHAWLEPVRPNMRHGVPYLGPNHPRRAAAPEPAAEEVP